ncbi:efflux RND transporter permease subunit [Parabacteroides sp. PF5-9]|uniref:efflux RND transporter permease subunit n=1 Tax=Parabacteroides sp. PF5-9 TaxID=1742404 RepID=UPI0024765832|nr:efflux RND transporter permease subunit [Parabacteroides sp. PF5-9]MDH6359226.1 HAE1 family hydrophobic/amphiphilic exporter-1 [Parabacteroides sp. PF5-9]
MTIKTFIDRPVLSIVISIAIILLGVIGVSSLPIEQYPDIAPPTVMVMTSYPGANAETVLKTVVAPLEEAINGVENMTYMTSEATNSGSVSIYVYFEQGTDPDMAAVNVQNRVSKATGTLPSEVVQIGVSTIKRQNSILQVLSLYSPDNRYDESFISNYARINLQPEILRITGVGEMVILSSTYSMRIWLKPDVMAQYHLVPSDIIGILGEQNIESGTGSFGENSSQTYQYTMKYKGRLVTPEQFGEMVIKALPNGEVLRVKDIADVEMDRDEYTYEGITDGYNGITCLIFQTTGSNATEVINNIDAFIENHRSELPEGLEIITMQSSNDFLFASFEEVLKTLIISIILVVLVVYFFLQNIRATIIPTISMIVSVIGTFAFMAVAGFSINLLTLFAIILCIGTVVDNAIVVVEAVQARFDTGYRSSYTATVDAMGGITSAIFASTLVFMAVFIPVAFMGGTSGTFYTQFGITMAVSVGISALNALTLCPALCALILKPHSSSKDRSKTFEGRLQIAFNTSFNAVLGRYKKGAMFFIKRKFLTWSIVVATVVLLVVLMRITPTGLVPEEDQGMIFVDLSTAPGNSLSETSRILDEVENRIKDIPQIEHYSRVSGYGMTTGTGTSLGMFILRLKDWNERMDKASSVAAIQQQIYGRTADIKDVSLFVFAPAMIPGYGTGNNIDLYMLDRTGGDMTEFYNITQEFVGKLNQRPEIQIAFSSYNINYPQYLVDVDAARCKRAGISPADVLNTLSGYYGGIYASNFNRFSKVYRVMVQASPEYRMDKESLNNIYVRIGEEMAPIAQFLTIEKVYGSETMNRYNLFNSIAVTVQPASGYSTGDAIQVIQEMGDQGLPRGYGYDFGGISREEAKGGNKTVVIFVICILLTYLILSGLYESFLIPLAVIISIPFGLAGSFIFAQLMGLENNIYLQTGLIMLIGLLAKTAILLTEYAVERRRSGMTLSQSAIAAAKARLRPILMTALTMIFGLLPMMFSSGVGANGNSSLGTGAIGGMLIGTIALLFIVPTLYVVFEYFQEKLTPLKETRTVPDRMIRKEKKEIEKEKAKKEK